MPLRAGSHWRYLAVLAVVVAAVYANTLSSPFMFDDDASVTDNAQIRDWRPATALFPHREAPTAGRPIVNFSFAANYAIGGLDVTGYHLVNIAVHLLCACLLFAIAWRTLELPGVARPLADRSAPLAFAIALLWAVHPLNSEAVDYITQRTESMMALFYLLTMYSAIRAVRAVRGSSFVVRRSGWTIAAVLSCAFGMACKESMVTAPVMVALYDRVFIFESLKEAWRRRRVLYLLLAATWIILALLVGTGPRVYSAGFRAGVDAWTYLLNQSVMIVRYLRLAVWPDSLVLAYGTPVPMTLASAMPDALVVIALLALTIVALVRWPRAGFPAAWFFVTLAPTSTIVPIATEVGAERRMYLPLAGVVALVVVGVVMLTARFVDAAETRRRALIGACAMLVAAAVALGGLTVQRNREYRSPLTMAQTVAARWPSAFGRTMLAVELAAAGRHAEALPYLRDAAPSFPKAHYHLGGEMFNAGNYPAAIEELQEFLRLQPYLLEAVRARLMLGRAYLATRKPAEAIEQFRLVLSMTSAADDAHVTATGFLGDGLFAQQKFAEALPYYRSFVAARPRDGGAMINYAIALSETGDANGAVAAFRRAVEINPSDTTARMNLAKALFNQGQLDAAEAEVRALLRVQPSDGTAHDLLGRALASRGQLREARAEFERALQLDPHDEQARADLALVMNAMRGGTR